MPAPLDPAVRAAIEADVRAGTLSRNAIARKHNVGTSTVSRLAASLDDLEGPAFDRTATAAATAAAQVDNAKRRAELEAELLAVAAEELARRDQPCVWGNFGGRDNTYAEHHLDAPTFGMRSTLVNTAARAIKAAADLANVGADPAQAGRSAVRELVEGLRNAEAAAS